MSYSKEHEAYIREHSDIQPDEDYEMDLSVSDRKKLWALSGNECARCKCKLVRKENSNANVGEECHISSEKSDWPSKEFSRYEPDLEEDKRNKSIDNAILLCANCHKIIDDPNNTQYTIERLHQIKEKHEADVKTGVDESKDKNKKKRISSSLLSEIRINQKLLRPLSDSVAKVLDGNDFTEDDKLPNMLIFESRIYSGSLDKFGVLDGDCRNKIVQYYSELKHIEEGYKKLDIQGCSYEHLVYLQLREIGKWRLPKPGWYEIDEFLRNTKKVQGFGEGLMMELKEQIGIKPTEEETELPVKVHLRTKSSDIRKLWSECEKLRTQISKDRKRIIEYIENEYGGLPPDFEWEPHPDKKKRPIYEMFEEYYKKAKISENDKIKDSKEFVETLIKDKTFSEVFETLRKNEADLYQKANEIELWLVKIEPDFEKRHNELKNLYESLE